jgi:FkbM family methyltransferase
LNPSFLKFIGRQRLLRFGLRDRIIRFFHDPDANNNGIFIENFFGFRYRGDFATFIDWNVYYFGAYSIQELLFSKDVLKRLNNPTVLDIGANVGHHTLFFSRFAKEVHAFEPNESVVKKLYEKIEVNQVKNITVHTVGLGDVNSNLQFHLPTNNNTGTGSFLKQDETKKTVELPVRRGDDYLKTIAVDKVDFIKMDIEGFEKEALKGLQQTLLRNRPVIFFEWSAKERGIKVALKELLPSDYIIYKFISDEPFLKFFNKAHYKLRLDDVYEDGNKVAIPRELQHNFKEILRDK